MIPLTKVELADLVPPSPSVRAPLTHSLSLWETARVRVLRRRSRHFARRQNDRDSVSDRNFISDRSRDICQNPGCRRFDLHRSLVGFNLHERLALGNWLTLGFKPVEQRSFFLRDAQRRHDYVSCHIETVARVRDACA